MNDLLNLFDISTSCCFSGSNSRYDLVYESQTIYVNQMVMQKEIISKITFKNFELKTGGCSVIISIGHAKKARLEFEKN